MTIEQKFKLADIMDEIRVIKQEVENEKGQSKEVKKLDTILGKIYNLIWES